MKAAISPLQLIPHQVYLITLNEIPHLCFTGKSSYFFNNKSFAKAVATQIHTEHPETLTNVYPCGLG